MSELAGRTLGRYRILEQVGKGGMASVYRAMDLSLQRDVALKVLSPALVQDERQFGARLRREAGVLVQLRHPHIVPVRDFGEQEGFVFLVMPFLRAGSLTERMRRGPLSFELVGRVIDQVSRALGYAHQRGVVHRDVKPSNILLDEAGNAFLTDFGLARLYDASLSLTGSALVGTPAYVSPEQARGGNVDGRSDEYALGVTLFQMATGQLPFEAETPMAVLLKHLSEPLPLPRSINPRVPESVERVILKAAAKDPAHRFDTVADFNAAFQAALAHARNPRAVPAPKFSLPNLSTSEARSGARQLAGTWNGLLRLGVISGTVVLFLLACPIVSSAALVFLERVSSPAEGSVEAIPTLHPLQATMIAATLAAIPTVTPADSAGAAGGNGKNGFDLTTGLVGVACDDFQVGAANVSGKNVRWPLLNLSANAARLEELRVEWPAPNGPLERVLFGADLVWQGAEGSSPAVIRPDAAGEGARLEPGGGVILTLGFPNPAEASGYRLTAVTSEGCAVEADH